MSVSFGCVKKIFDRYKFSVVILKCVVWLLYNNKKSVTLLANGGGLYI
jgi:hypothetical protein